MPPSSDIAAQAGGTSDIEAVATLSDDNKPTKSYGSSKLLTSLTLLYAASVACGESFSRAAGYPNTTKKDNKMLAKYGKGSNVTEEKDKKTIYQRMGRYGTSTIKKHNLLVLPLALGAIAVFAGASALIAAGTVSAAIVLNSSHYEHCMEVGVAAWLTRGLQTAPYTSAPRLPII